MYAKSDLSLPAGGEAPSAPSGQLPHASHVGGGRERAPLSSPARSVGEGDRPRVRPEAGPRINSAVEGAAPAIILAGKHWPVPRLAPRQNRIVVPALLQLIPRIVKARAEAIAAKENDLAWLGRFVDQPTYDQLVTIAYTALTRAQPEFARAAFDDMAIETLELIGAIYVIARQAGLLRSAPTPPHS